MDRYELGAVVVVTAYNAFLIGGTAWLITQGWSPWWMALALMFTKSIRTGKAAEADND